MLLPPPLPFPFPLPVVGRDRSRGNLGLGGGFFGGASFGFLLRDEVGDVALDLREEGALLVVAGDEVSLRCLDLRLRLLGDCLRGFSVGLARREHFLRVRELVHERLLALRGERCVLLSRGELGRGLRVEVGDRAGGTRLRVDGHRAPCELGAQVVRLRLRRGDLRVRGGDGRGRGVERDLRAVDLFVQRVDAHSVVVDLLRELRGFCLLVIDRCSRCRDNGAEERTNGGDGKRQHGQV